MKLLFAAFIIAAVFAVEMIVTREYTDYLKKHVDWEVVDYEDNIFRGWTVEEFDSLLLPLDSYDQDAHLEEGKIDEDLPSSIDWTGANCIHEVRDQKRCGSCWAFATAGMLSDRCCLHSSDHGWLSPQELVSCDRGDKGCQGGWPTRALSYVKKEKGLVPEKCFPYKATNGRCTKVCVNKSNWKTAHVCSCSSIMICSTPACYKTALKTGPVAIAFGVCQSFSNYRRGIYKCNCKRYRGLHAVVVTGIQSSPCNFKIRNSWGTKWGMSGYFQLACGSCGAPGQYRNGNVYCPNVK